MVTTCEAALTGWAAVTVKDPLEVVMTTSDEGLKVMLGEEEESCTLRLGACEGGTWPS